MLYHYLRLEKELYCSLVNYRDKVIRYLERVAPHLLIPFFECILFGACGCEIDEEEEGLDALDIIHEDTFEFLDESSSPTSLPSTINVGFSAFLFFNYASIDLFNFNVFPLVWQ